MRDASQPTGLLCDLLSHPERTRIRNPRPRFSWIVPNDGPGLFQHGFQIMVSQSRDSLAADAPDAWDSGMPDPGAGWTTDARSLNVEYDGVPLSSNTTYHWKVRIWTAPDLVGPWSEVQTFHTGRLSDTHTTASYTPTVSEIEPVQVAETGPNTVFLDFGRAAFATLALTIDSPRDADCVIHLGEVLHAPREIERIPGGSRRYRRIPLRISAGKHVYQLEIPPDERNTGPMAISMPKAVFEVCPFRYCEIEGCPGYIDRDSVRQLAVHYPFDDDSASFTSSSTVLNDVYELCKYTMKATSFCGYYVDGDRERIPYEADAYVNALGHYGVDREASLARRTHEYLITTPTWPTEWFLYSVLVAWNDYMYTGDTSSIAHFYEDLEAKSLTALAREDGLVSTETGLLTPEVEGALHFTGRSKEFYKQGIRDIVDWPQGERDDYDLRPVNAVVNALHYRALLAMADIAGALGKTDEAWGFRDRGRLVQSSFLSKMIDPETGLVLDGEGSGHSSLHANAFALAAGLVPEGSRPAVLRLLRTKGMACSVYVSQILMEALYAAGDGDYALALLTSTGERSWAHMIYDVGTTIALEAWDDRIKPNQDWNHAWGAAPAGIIPTGLMGITPLEPGFKKIQIRPQPGDLSFAQIVVPTIRGRVGVSFNNVPGRSFRLEVDVPGNTTAKVILPVRGAGAELQLPPRHRYQVIVDGRAVFAVPAEQGGLAVDDIGPGRHVIAR